MFRAIGRYGAGVCSIRPIWLVISPSGSAELQRGPLTVGDDQLVEEHVISFTHTREIMWMLPGVAPTGKPVSWVCGEWWLQWMAKYRTEQHPLDQGRVGSDWLLIRKVCRRGRKVAERLARSYPGIAVRRA